MVAFLGTFNRLDKWIQDDILLRPQALTGDVVVIGIDDDSLERLGPYNTWDRSVMASALKSLSAAPQNLPAVVAIDTLYSGTTDPAADDSLVSAARALPKVITASAGVFGSEFVDDGKGSFARQDHMVLGYEEPYQELKSVSTQGHINAMYDLDGVLRHGLLYFDHDGTRIYSMAWEVAKAYAEAEGRDLVLPETDRRGHYYLTYSARPGTYYDGWNIADLIEGKIPSDYYAGKIVFLGPYSAGLQDEYFTTIDRAKSMYGVEVQANAVEAFLRADYKSEAADYLQAFVLFVVLVALLALFLKLRPAVSGAVAAIACVAGLVAAYVLFGRGLILHPLWLPLGALLMYVASIVVHYVRAYLERIRVTRLLQFRARTLALLPLGLLGAPGVIL